MVKISLFLLLLLTSVLWSCHLEPMPISESSAVPSVSAGIEPEIPEPASIGSQEPVQPEPSASAESFDILAAMKAYYQPLPKRWSNCRGDLKVDFPSQFDVRKSFMGIQDLPAEQVKHSFDIELSTLDLKRRMILNLRQGEIPIDEIKVKVNGVELETFFPNNAALRSDVPDMFWDLCTYLHKGENQVEFLVQGEPGASVWVFLDGFIMINDIPGALADVGVDGLNREEFERLPKFISINFIEKMKVRLNTENIISEQLIDLSNLSLYPLRLLIQEYPVELIKFYFSGTPKEHELLDQERDRRFPEATNENLMYTLWFSERPGLYEQMHEFVRVLSGMPIFADVSLAIPEPDYEDPCELLPSGCKTNSH